MITAMAFIRNNWQALAIIAIAGVIFMRIDILKSERDDALATIAEMRTAALKQAVEVKVSAQAGKQAVQAVIERNKSDIQHIGGLYANEIQKRDATINNYRRELADRLREQSNSSDSSMQTHDANITAGNDSNGVSTAESVNCAAEKGYISTLEEAGAVCAADYNMCRAYVVTEQQRIGVHE